MFDRHALARASRSGFRVVLFACAAAACADADAASGSAAAHGGSGGTATAPSGGAGGAVAAGTGDAGATGGAAAAAHGGGGGSSGSAAGSGGAGKAGDAASEAGAGGASGACTLACVKNEHCQLITVQCIRAPCPPEPMCVADANASSGGACGSRGQAACPSGQYCDYGASAQCGADDSGGTCTDRPDVCNDLFMPVCGCDGTTYSNACSAAAKGVSVASQGACM